MPGGDKMDYADCGKMDHDEINPLINHKVVKWASDP